MLKKILAVSVVIIGSIALLCSCSAGQGALKNKISGAVEKTNEATQFYMEYQEFHEGNSDPFFVILVARSGNLKYKKLMLSETNFSEFFYDAADPNKIYQNLNGVKTVLNSSDPSFDSILDYLAELPIASNFNYGEFEKFSENNQIVYTMKITKANEIQNVYPNCVSAIHQFTVNSNGYLIGCKADFIQKDGALSNYLAVFDYSRSVPLFDKTGFVL